MITHDNQKKSCIDVGKGCCTAICLVAQAAHGAPGLGHTDLNEV